MLYALPMMYRVQKEHLPDYYFCFTKIADPMAIVLPFKFLCHQGWFNKVILKIIEHYGSTFCPCGSHWFIFDCTGTAKRFSSWFERKYSQSQTSTKISHSVTARRHFMNFIHGRQSYLLQWCWPKYWSFMHLNLA